MKNRIAFLVYFSFGDLREVTFLNYYGSSINFSIIRKTLLGLIKSILRGKKPLGILNEGKEVRKIYFGVPGISQKVIKEVHFHGKDYFIKEPLVETAYQFLDRELRALKIFRYYGINCMRHAPNLGQYAFEKVYGHFEYNIKSIVDNYIKHLPVSPEKSSLQTIVLEGLNFEIDIELLPAKYECTVAHGDLTSWNSIFCGSELVLIDLERFKDDEIIYYDLFYYILSEEILKRKCSAFNLLIEMEKMASFLDIKFNFIIIILLIIRKDKLLESKDGYSYKERTFFLSKIEELIKLVYFEKVDN